MHLEIFILHFVVSMVASNALLRTKVDLMNLQNFNGQVIYWNTFAQGHWAYFCDFPISNTLTEIETNMLTTCQDRCEQTDQCSHFTWDASSLICKLKNGTVYKKDAVYTENGNLGCGLFDLVPRMFFSSFYKVYSFEANICNHLSAAFEQ